MANGVVVELVPRRNSSKLGTRKLSYRREVKSIYHEADQICGIAKYRHAQPRDTWRLGERHDPKLDVKLKQEKKLPREARMNE
jgi:hypothetical protein